MVSLETGVWLAFVMDLTNLVISKLSSWRCVAKRKKHEINGSNRRFNLSSVLPSAGCHSLWVRSCILWGFSYLWLKVKGQLSHKLSQGSWKPSFHFRPKNVVLFFIKACLCQPKTCVAAQKCKMYLTISNFANYDKPRFRNDQIRAKKNKQKLKMHQQVQSAQSRYGNCLNTEESGAKGTWKKPLEACSERSSSSGWLRVWLVPQQHTEAEDVTPGDKCKLGSCYR